MIGNVFAKLAALTYFAGSLCCLALFVMGCVLLTTSLSAGLIVCALSLVAYWLWNLICRFVLWLVLPQPTMAEVERSFIQ